jgi:hypothetical protein
MATIRLGDGYEVTRYEGGLSISPCLSGHAPCARLFLSPAALEQLRWLLSGTSAERDAEQEAAYAKKMAKIEAEMAKNPGNAQNLAAYPQAQMGQVKP